MAATDWDPALYRRFEAERTRPAQELLARVPLQSPKAVVDLGCGPGNSTELLAALYPGADIVGLDSSAAMIAAARERLPRLLFTEGDLDAWQPAAQPDLLFANAVLQWMPDPGASLERLFGLLAPGGALAVQMPDNLDEPSHRAMREVAGQDRWRERLADAVGQRRRLPSTDAIYDRLARIGGSVDIWRTTYHHVMPSPRSIVDWLRSTGLRPFTASLPPADQAAFLSTYEREIDVAYPPRADGSRLLAFPRLFVVAIRPGT